MAQTKKFIVKENKIIASKSFDTKHYEEFKDTIKYFPHEKWLTFIMLVKSKEDRKRYRNKLIFELLLSTGMRIEEFSLIKFSDIDFKEAVIKIPKENTKAKRSRTVRVKRDLILDLKDFLQQNNIKSGYIFKNKKNEPLDTRTYRKVFDKYFLDPRISTELELDFKPHPHTFRHCHVIYSLQKGVPINAVMENVGHLNLETTQIYSRLAGIDISKAYKDLDF